jgi:hypothetical protein
MIQLDKVTSSLSCEIVPFSTAIWRLQLLAISVYGIANFQEGLFIVRITGAFPSL